MTPDDYGFSVSVNLVVMNVIGGISHPLGVVLGALLLTIMPEFLRDAQQYHGLVYGVLLIVFLLFMPEGLYGAIRRFRRNKREGSA